MMKNLSFLPTLLLLAFYFNPLFSQNRPAQAALFTVENARGDFSKNVKSATWLRLDEARLDALVAEKPRFLNFEIPGENGRPLRLTLERTQIVTADFQAKMSDGSPVNATVLHYQGAIAGEGREREKAGTLAAVSFSPNEVMALVSDENGQTRTLGKYGDPARGENAGQYVFYADNQLVGKQPFACGTADSGPENPPGFSEGQRSGASPHKDVRIYFEVDNTLFNNLGGTASNAILYALGIFNISSMIYRRENVTVRMSGITIWSTPDPYPNMSQDTCGDLLDAFGAQMAGGFPGDLAHLLDGNNSPCGRGWVGVLCHQNVNWRCAVSSSLKTYFDFFPAYSWEANVVTHEMGHNLGSQHTQWCDWPGGAIDGCVAPEGSCSPGPLPTNGGTVMSYCHLTSIGMNLQKGFGPLPGNAIRAHINGSACVQTAGFECDAAANIHCGDVVNGNTAGGPQNVSAYGCTWWNEAGPERAYRLTLTEKGAITAALSNLSADLDVFILNNCSENSCLASGDNSASTGILPPGEYFIVVDGFAGATGSFTLNLTCNGYCFSVGTTDFEFIQSITIDGNTRFSGNNKGYNDEASVPPPGFGAPFVFNLQRGVSHSFVLTPGFPNGAYNENWFIWLDLNADRDFDDPGELVFSQTSPPVADPVFGSFSIPPFSGVTGPTRMRVKMSYGNSATPCDEYSFGETEDYAVLLDDYCPNGGSNGLGWHIQTAQIGFINNTSGAAPYGYGNHMNHSTFILKGTDVPYTLVPGDGSDVFGWSIFADLNHDFDFDDAGETLLELPGAPGTRTGTFSIPHGTGLNGWARLRLTMQYPEPSTPCNTYGGEVEDYLVYADDYCQTFGLPAVFIETIHLGNTSNASGQNLFGYGDYTNLTENIGIGAGGLQTTLVPGGNSVPGFWKVFADLNRDFDFEDNGELIFQAAANPLEAVATNLTIPLNATPGPTRLRIIFWEEDQLTPCPLVYTGETEDYTLNLVKHCGTPTGVFASLTSATAVLLAQEKQSGADRYRFRHRLQGATNWTTSALATASTKALSGLVSGATYEYQAQVRCIGNTYSDWSWPQTFTVYQTGTPCAESTQRGEIPVGPTAWTVYYDYSKGTYYQVRYAVAGTGAWVTAAQTTATKRALSNLLPFTAYEWQLRTRCGTVWGAWSASRTFTTWPTYNFGGTGDDRESIENEPVEENFGEAGAGFRAFPNPFDESLSVEFESSGEGEVLLEMFDLAGRPVLQKRVAASEGLNLVRLETGALGAGVWFLRCNDGENARALRLVK